MQPATRPIPAPANPGGSATAVLYDNGLNIGGTISTFQVNDVSKATKELKRVRVFVFMDQAATFKVEVFAPGSTNARMVNGLATPPAGEAIAASVPFFRDVLLFPGRTKISITTGSNPTVWELAIEGVMDHALAQ